MDFALTEEHRMVREMVRRFVENEVKPFIRDWIGMAQTRRFIRGWRSWVCWASASRANGVVPGWDYISLGIACEELEYGDTFLRVIMSVHVGLTALTLLSWGSEAQKERFLLPQATRAATGGVLSDRAERR
jgi:glutaryl-CoA dehydrogenase (non-decarboxylating)